MRVLRLAESGRLIPGDAPQPSPGRGELLVGVRAAGVISAELSWYSSTHGKSGEARTGAIPSHEFSGVVAAKGEESGALETGSEVFGMNDWYADGAMADYCLAPFDAVALKPARLSYAEAASVPISALTAWQGLFDHARLQSGERILVHGGAGSVGAFVVQLARLHGAYVVATASEADREFVTALGAERVIDYRASRFEECVKGVDIVFDTVGGDTLERSWAVLKPLGRLVTVASTTVDSTDERAKKALFIVEPNRKQLAEIAALLDGGQLRTVVGAVVPWSQASETYAGKVVKGPGKLVVSISRMN